MVDDDFYEDETMSWPSIAGLFVVILTSVSCIATLIVFNLS